MRKLGKKDFTLLFLSIALIISIIGNGILIFNYPQISTQRDPLTLVVGTYDPTTLEIVDSDHTSEDTLGQVVETLFTYDLRDPDLPRINLLAESYWWENSTTLHIKLREEILFHDGTPFNASAVKWNFDRLQYLINATGTNKGEVAHSRELWMRPDRTTPIINNSAITGEYNITIELNGAYGPFLNTLTLIQAGMLSPVTHENDTKRFLTLSDKPVGTGPFIYEHYIPDVEVLFSRWNEYWNHVVYFKTLRYKIYDYYDTNGAHQDMLNGQIDINMLVDEYKLIAYEEDNDIIVERYTDDAGIPGLDYSFLSFNNKKFNQTWRKAFSWALNYSYIFEELLKGTKVRSYSPISPGFGDAYNSSVPFKAIPNSGNITFARMVVQSMGFGLNLDLYDDAAWVAQARSAPFRSYDYIHNPLNTFMSDLGVAISNWLDLIGVAQNIWVYDDPMEYYNYIYDRFDLLGISPIAFGWGPAYLDPFDMFDPLFNPTSLSNIALVNDTILNSMMTLSLETTDDTARNRIYKDIQGYMAEEGYFHAPLYHSKLYFVHSADLQGFPYNAMGKFQAQGIWRE